MFKAGTKKISIIAGAIASAITLSTFSGFAIGPTTESLSEQTIGVSSELSSPSEQTVDNSTDIHKDFVNEEIIEDALPKIIELNTPGDYRLVGAEKGSSNNHDENEIIVNTNDAIVINGDGKYNITLDNVNIDIDYANCFKYFGGDRFFVHQPIAIKEKADVNLTLVGKNSLKNNCKYTNALLICNSARLTINESSAGACLDVFGKGVGMYSDNDLTINGGTINANGGSIEANGDFQGGILCLKNLTINNSTITATATNSIYGSGMSCLKNLMINNSKITATGKDHGIDCHHKLAINNSIVNVTSDEEDGVYCDYNSTITGSKITATGKDHGINCDANLTITDSTITAAAAGSAICCNDNLTTNNSTLNASSDKSNGIYCTNDLTIDGGAVNARKILANNNLMLKSGELVTRSINDVVWKDIVWDGGTIRKMEKVFGIFDATGSLVACSKNNTGGNVKPIGYLAKINDPKSNENKYLFIGNNTTINGVKFVDKDCDKVDYKMKDGNNFVTASSRNNYNDLELFFE